MAGARRRRLRSGRSARRRRRRGRLASPLRLKRHAHYCYYGSDDEQVSDIL
jgi:hypothetical protein